MKIGLKEISVIIIFFCMIVGYQLFIINNQNNEMKRLDDEINQLKMEIDKLNEENQQLNKSYIELTEKYSSLETVHSNLKNEIDSTLTNIEKYQSELEKSMDWFRTNSYLDDSENQKNAKSRLNIHCFEISENECRIKTICLYFVNDVYLYLDYKSDYAPNSPIKDRLLFLQEFLDKKGGDCEDYSLLFKAEFNYFLEKCKDTNSSNIIIESWYERSDYNYYVNFLETWSVKGAYAIELKKSFIYPNIICGNMYDLNLKEISGHCMIAFTKNRIATTEDIIEELDLAPVVEPQNGIYMGLINHDSSDIYLRPKDSDSYIYEIITDSDLFLYNETFGKWISYSFFYDELENKKNDLQNLRKQIR